VSKTVPADLFDLSEQVALVTGAGSGLGRSFSFILAAHGAAVICADLDLQRAEETRSLIEADGGKAFALQIDVTQVASVDFAMAQTMACFGRVDILINNAGIISHPLRTHEVAVADWDRVIDIDLKGVFLCSRAAIPVFLRDGGGTIINIASIIGVLGFYPGFACASANYVAAKAGVIGLTRQIAVEYAKDNIRANTIAPGFHTGTRLAEGRRAASSESEIRRFDEAIVARTPAGRKGKCEELDGLVLYLASKASSFVTGQVFSHDGGWTAT
jgi:NAD(P)-dependent dehydrogenase (short-subunit alcohol dehydrogenase family)